MESGIPPLISSEWCCELLIPFAADAHIPLGVTHMKDSSRPLAGSDESTHCRPSDTDADPSVPVSRSMLYGSKPGMSANRGLADGLRSI